MVKKNNKNNKKNEEKTNYRENFAIYLSFLKKYWVIFAFLLVVGFISQANGTVNSYLFKYIVDYGTEFSDGTLALEIFMNILGIILVVFIISSIVKFVFEWLFTHLLIRLNGNLVRDLKQRFFNHIIKLSHNFHTTHKTGSLISRLGRGAGAMERMTDVLAFNFTPLIFALIIVGGSLAYFSKISAIVLVLTSIAFVLYSWIVLNLQKKWLLASNKTQDYEKGNLADFFTNVDSVKYFGKEGNVISRFKKLTRKTFFAEIKSADFWRWLDSGQTLIMSVGTFFLIYFPLQGFLKGEITIGTLVFIYSIYGNIFWPLYSFMHGIRHFYHSMADFDALFQYGKIKQEVKDKPEAKTAKIRRGIVEFDNVSFSYGKRKIFKNLNLKIPEGKKIAFVGHSGCGKSTLVKLLYRFYDLNSGEIRVDGKSITEYKQESLRSEMSIVPQEPILFDDSIYNNIKFSNPSATKKQVMKAIKFAQLDKIIKKFPKKENTIVGERGVKLSGGEKQRVSIARAILANKKILVLDEATSALDSETEAEIQKDLNKLMEGRTSLIIAHRLSTIMHADIIVVMKEGRIIQMGDHRELITEGGEYQRLWDLQKGGYIR
jgi:ABC-type multidrug transport system fused ATPase/permease subunit